VGPLVPGSTAQLSFTGTNNTLDTAHLHIWADWNSDGILEYVDSAESWPSTTVLGQIVNFERSCQMLLFAGGKVYFRFRFTTDVHSMLNQVLTARLLTVKWKYYFLPIFKMGNLVWEDRQPQRLSIRRGGNQPRYLRMSAWYCA